MTRQPNLERKTSANNILCVENGLNPALSFFCHRQIQLSLMSICHVYNAEEKQVKDKSWPPHWQ